ncbi:von Willebrand factor D and EGF domain-containing protein-like [Saccostrea echinata]|uniref:von Willebrand factor D and EGF domain-containing protein-like n=1 Tax=Saccostrea echinata TaxID=191078 RepID=UPI002A7EFF02|nr:von Willebrand factor D and EGF domain-containing protein-like [Saccostrea echinata]
MDFFRDDKDEVPVVVRDRRHKVDKQGTTFECFKRKTTFQVIRNFYFNTKTCFYSSRLVHSLDPCLHYNSHDDPHRSALFQPESTDKENCDHQMKEGWYVFNGGNDTIPNHCVTKYHCGTKFPVWMKGQLPSVRDGVVNRHGCIALTHSTNVLCCEIVLDMKVKNCGSFYVYYLKPTPFCPAAYCAGETYTCNVGNSGGQCKDLYPKMTSFPVLRKPEIVLNTTVRFPCDVQYPPGQPDVGFEVTWTVDGQTLVDPDTGTLIVEHLTGDSRTVYLDYNKLKGNFGKTLKCRVRSYYTNTTIIKSDSITSDGYYCGIKVLTEKIVVDEKGPEKTVQVESTIPVPCNTAHIDECKISFSVDTHTKDAMFSTCSYDIKLDPVTGRYLGSFKVTATKDFVSDGTQTHEVSFKPIVDFNHPVWMGYNVHPIHVTTVSSEHGHCNAHGDPHVIGMDHKRNTNVYVTGEMTLYECKSASNPLQVQVKTWPCGNYHPCICALVAREGNDAVQIDMCERRRNKHAVPEVTILSERGLNGTTLSRDQSGKSFFINFPSGARVFASTYVLSPHGHPHEKDGMINVDIQAPPDNKGCGQGICGLWNDNPNDDLVGADGRHYSHKQVTEFANTWRVKSSERLFNQILSYQPFYSTQHTYCTCSNGRVDCTKKSKNPNKNNCNGKCKSVRASKLNRHRYRRYSDDDLDGEEAVDDVITQKRENFNYKPRDVFPTGTGINETQAKKVCVDGLGKSTLYTRCHHEPGMNITALIDSCMEDVKASGSDLFLVTQMAAFDSWCQNEAMKNISNYKKSPDGDLIPPLDVTDHVCPNQCSQRGTCLFGQCKCAPGYTAVDCSVKSNEPPNIVRIRGDGLCDIRKRFCVRTNVLAENIMETEKMTCRFQPLTGSGTLKIVPAELVSAWEILCPVPVHYDAHTGRTLQQYNVSISLDNTTFSNEQTYTVYDSVCQQCDVTGQCLFKKDACLIDGNCFQSGYLNEQHNKVCNPSQSQYQWSSPELDHYTAISFGCQCQHEQSSYNCACCRNGGCQCPRNPNKCGNCHHLDC